MNYKKKIIIVENEEDWSKKLIEILTSSILKNRLNIEPFSSYEVASEWFIKNEDYDLAIIDLNLRAEDRAGLKFRNSLKSPIVIVSGDTDTAKLWTESDEKVAGYLDKGNFDPFQFVLLIEKILFDPQSYKLEKKYELPSQNIIVQEPKEITIIHSAVSYYNNAQTIDINKIINLLTSSLKDILSAYHEEIKTDLNLVIHELGSNIKLYQDKLNDFNSDMQKLKNENIIIKDYLNEIDTANNTNNKYILENKLKLSISIIPGLLKLEPGMDLNACLKNLYKKYDDISFKILKKWSEFYFSLLERIKSNKII